MGTITKALELLGLFSRARPEIGLGEFVRLTGRDKATVHRHLVELERNGFLEQHPGTRAYRLGPAILRLSGVREATHPVRSALRPVVERMAAALGELVHVSLLQGRQLSPAVHADPLVHGTAVHFDEAEMLPLHATSSGLAVLAFAGPALAEAVLAGPLATHTGRTITDAARLRALLDAVRESGVASLDRAFDDEVCSQGVPIFGASGAVAGALSVAVPVVRATAAKRAAVRDALLAGAVEASRALGGTVPEPLARTWREAAADPGTDRETDPRSEPQPRRA